ncbi:hypothetical protein GGF46_000209 [Coemansia sp. RSA 552]|nr:hypothetical protein GGF46_000209 [Coemansia sp. RSA 552]
MTRDDKPRGLRARLRQRRARNSSEDETRPRPTSLDLGRPPPAMLGAAMHSMTSVPTHRHSAYYGNDSMESHVGGGGLALGEFAEDGGGEIIEDEEHTSSTRPAVRPSGAIVRSPIPEYEHIVSDGHEQHPGWRRSSARRESSQSVPVYDADARAREGVMEPEHEGDTERHLALSEGSGGESASPESARHTDHLSYEYSYDEDEDSEGDMGVPGEHGELGAVYLKRNTDFHTLFRNIPINELLIDDFGCALQRDILVQGRLYLTENYVSFYSNIFGWVTNLVIAFDEIVSIEKRMTALIIPNAIQISTLHAKHFFGSFIYRDSAYNYLYDLWSKSRNEKNAELPEIGRAEAGDGAGDVSRHRTDVMNAYQSLSEDEDHERSRGLGPASTIGSEEEGSVSDDDEEEGSEPPGVSGSGSESDGSQVCAAESKQSLTNSADTTPPAAGGISGAATVVPVVKGGKSKDSLLAGDATPLSANDASSSATPLTAAESAAEAPATVANSAADVTRAASQVTAAAEPNGNVAGASRLLARLPNTPDGTDAASLASSMKSKSSKKGTGSKRRESAEVPLHDPTTCPCGTGSHSAHYNMEALDAVFPLSLPLLFRLVFSASVPLDVEQKYLPADKVSSEELAKSCTKRIVEAGNSDVKTEGWVPDPSDSGLEMCIYSYDKPLGFSIGPKSTTVEDTFRITALDFDKCVIVEQIVRTPNVPSGTAFFVKIRHCLTWTSGPSNQPPGGWSQYRMTFEVEWVKTSWIKNAIEKGSVDSNKQAGELLEKYIREWIAAHPSMEVKAASAIVPKAGAKASASSGGAHKQRHRKGGRKSKRDGSPRGLRMEEILGSGSERRGRRAYEASESRSQRDATGAAAVAAAAAAAAASAGGSGAASSAAMLGGISSAAGQAMADDAADKAWKKRAETSWVGWLGYHSVCPLRRGLRVVGSPAVGPVLVAVFAVLLVVSNMWRLGMPGSSPLERIQQDVDSLGVEMAEIRRQLQQLVELQAAGLQQSLR